ncbi:membrane protein [Geotalea uraniireducens]|uniref:Membrane protein n=1 Tax=Geotalea uraniireducens TaxID=351604 RepID=A0ABM8ERC6_9BACT|nr:thioredoxin family protein [Geotalea uraniireducens]BDV44922.1 membrane protein [Geotalea uraniireducens]
MRPFPVSRRPLRRFMLPLIALALCLAGIARATAPPRPVTLHFFWEQGCPVCAKAAPFIAGLQQRYPNLRIIRYEVVEHPENLDLLVAMAKARGQELQGVPTVFVGRAMFVGFSAEIGRAIEERVRRCLSAGCTDSGDGTLVTAGDASAIDLPLVGRVDGGSLSLPLFTLMIAGLDSLNPCSIFVLFFLLSLLIHAHSRFRLAVVGGTFVFCSALIYFLFMAAWLNFFLFVGRNPLVTGAAGTVALLIAALNIKDFFLFGHSISLSIPATAKPRLFERMRRIMQSGSLPAMLAATCLLAIAANSYGLLCTAGFPMIFIRVLTLHPLPATSNLFYLLLYNLVHVIPLTAIVAFFAATLESRKLSEREGRRLKLSSGIMMLCLGLILLIRPVLLNSAGTALSILAAALGGSWLLVHLAEKRAGGVSE